MKIAILSCSNIQKKHTCVASELYLECPTFRLSYLYSKKVADEVYILSPKYGLVSEALLIEPYSETLSEMNTRERTQWINKVLYQLKSVVDMHNDEFIILAGTLYHEYLTPQLKNYWLPLKGIKEDNWIPELTRLIDSLDGKGTCIYLRHHAHKPVNLSSTDIRKYIEQKLCNAKDMNLKYIDLISGQIHKELKLSNRVPTICTIMYKLKKEKDEVLYTSPSGIGSTVKIRYYL